MQFGIKERINLLGLLPREGNFIDMKVIRALQNALSFSEADHKDFELQVEGEGGGQRILWNETKEKPKEVAIGPRARVLIENALKKLDETGKIGKGHLRLFDLFFLD